MAREHKTAVIEVAGRNWLVSQFLQRHLEVAVPVVDQGIDLVVFKEVKDLGVRALPFQLKCAADENFSLDAKYEGRGIIIAYVWNVLSSPTVFFLSYDEALAALGEKARATSSWKDSGYYAKTSIDVVLRDRLTPHQDRWAWIEERLAAQPTSGA